MNTGKTPAFTFAFVAPLALSALLAYSAAAHAASTGDIIKQQAPKGITSTFYACVDQAGSDTIALGACLSAERKTQDARLNRAYRTLLGSLHGNAKDRLVTAERAWLDLQKKNGDFDAALYGDASVADLQVTQNEMFRLCERADWLEKYAVVAKDD